jgi:molybdenum cofactor cytidylyltransferase
MRNIGAVILAAGESSRFGKPKQLAQFRGKSFLRRIVDAANEAGCSPVVVVANDESKIDSELKQSPATIVKNKEWRRGIGTSIRAGAQSLIASTPELDAIVLLVCDQPFVDFAIIKELITRRDETNKAIVASSYANTLGVPALFDRSCFRELLALDDDSGAKKIILSNGERVAAVLFAEGQIDIDTAADYTNLLESSDRPD